MLESAFGYIVTCGFNYALRMFRGEERWEYCIRVAISLGN